MFVDKATVTINAGDGGRGVINFRQEKYVDKGGPDGGDGGNGGNVIFVASRNENTLADFRFQKELRAPSGEAGAGSRKHGKSGLDLRVAVPVGTAIVDNKGNVLADLTVDGQEAVIAKGGRGGFGNAHFASSRRQAPRIAEKGEPGESLTTTLELKMIADVGLIGLPNAGKSTLLSVISNARPEIANYPFTTLIPNLGVVDVDGSVSILFADIPGLIEGASAGKGLGDEFLRHVERTAVLVHLIDAYQEDIAGAYKTIQEELAAYTIDLSGRPQIVVLTKIEGLDKEIIDDQLKQLRKTVSKGTECMAISAHSGQGIADFLRKVAAIVKRERTEQNLEKPETMPGIPVITLTGDDDAWSVEPDGENTFVVTGRKIERFAARTYFNSPAGVERIRDIMRKMGILHELVRRGIKPGDTIRIGDEGELTY